MIVRHPARPSRVLLVALGIACLALLVPGAAAVSITTGTFQAGSAGETVSVPIILDSAPQGIAGYQITAGLSNPAVATITAVEFPGWASLKTASSLPSSQVELKSVDLTQQVPLGAGGVTLAILTIRATAGGSTGITITPDPSMGVQDRNGNLYPVSAVPGTLTVAGGGTGPAPPTVPTQGSVPTPVTTVPSVVIPTTVPTQGVIPTTVATVPPVIVPTTIPTQGGSVSPEIVPTVYPVAPVTTVPGFISPDGGGPVVPVPVTIAPGTQPTFSFGKRYAISDPGSFIGTRFGVGGTGTATPGPRSVSEIEPTLKPGSRAYGLKPPAGRFIRWYPAARWAAGIK
jgi:hypothetical protein